MGVDKGPQNFSNVKHSSMVNVGSKCPNKIKEVGRYQKIMKLKTYQELLAAMNHSTSRISASTSTTALEDTFSVQSAQIFQERLLLGRG